MQLTMLLGFSRVVDQKAHHVAGAALRTELVEELTIVAGIDQGQPGLGAARRAVEGHGFADLKEARQVFRSLDIAVDPIKGVGDAAQHVASSTIQVSLHAPALGGVHHQ